MDETTNYMQSIMTALLYFGGFMTALVVRKRHRKNPPDTEALTKTLAARPLSTKQGILLGAILFSLYFLAGCSGQFFYEEQVPLIRLIAQLTIYAVFGVALILINRPRIERFGMGIRNLDKLLLGAVFYLATVPFLMMITGIYHKLLELLFGAGMELQEVSQYMRGDLSWLEICYILTAILGAPVYEEIIFRGLLFPYLLKRAGLKAAIIFTAVLFAAIHVHLPSAVPLALLSAVLCLAYWRTGSLWTSIGIHITWNAVSILALNISG